MVQHLHTPVALAAVLGSDWAHGLAGVAEVVDGVVHVVIVTPGRRVSYL